MNKILSVFCVLVGSADVRPSLLEVSGAPSPPRCAVEFFPCVGVSSLSVPDTQQVPNSHRLFEVADSAAAGTGRG